MPSLRFSLTEGVTVALCFSASAVGIPVADVNYFNARGVT